MTTQFDLEVFSVLHGFKIGATTEIDGVIRHFHHHYTFPTGASARRFCKFIEHSNRLPNWGGAWAEALAPTSEGEAFVGFRSSSLEAGEW